MSRVMSGSCRSHRRRLGGGGTLACTGRGSASGAGAAAAGCVECEAGGCASNIGRSGASLAAGAGLAVVDAVAGQPFHTFTVLGGIVLFTAMHCLLNVVYGVVLVSGIRGAVNEPSLIIAVLFGFVMVEIAFAMVTVLLSNLGLGELAWVGIFGGSLIGAVIAIVHLSRRYPVATRLRQAEHER